ncbi:hypothetical protein BGX29_005881 [Mortierella sp. GBA35]|nr:hypothetical protein BGX29_005881 [Mortierella sp. GBA35]
MKNALATTLLTVAVSQVVAVVPIPIKECTKTVVVDPKYDSCDEFAKDFNITFKDLLKYNEKLRKDCMNLNTGEKMCVSINPDGMNPPPLRDPKPKKENVVTAAPKNKMETKPKTTDEADKPEDAKKDAAATEAKTAEKKKHDEKKDTPAVTVPAANGASSNTVTNSPAKQPQHSIANGGSGTISSLAVAAAGVLLPVVYML